MNLTAPPPDPLIPELVGESPVFEQLTTLLRAHAEGSEALLLGGEPGTGKRLLAHGVHDLSERSGPLMALDCAELPEAVLARALLGRRGRGGLLESAADGTLLLLHIDGLGPRLERRLLRQFEAAEPTERPRLLGTINLPMIGPDALPSLGGSLHRLFGERLFGVPALRHRDQDLELLTDHFLQLFAPGDAAPPVTSAARFALQSHRWPGNVRELRAVLRQAAELGDEIRPETLAIKTRSSAVHASTGPSSPARSHLEGRALAEIEAEAIRATLSATRGNRSAAAKQLGISRPTLLRKIRIYSIDL